MEDISCVNPDFESSSGIREYFGAKNYVTVGINPLKLRYSVLHNYADDSLAYYVTTENQGVWYIEKTTVSNF